jgi:hypothetical protein
MARGRDLDVDLMRGSRTYWGEEGSGNLVTESRDMDAFTSIEASSSGASTVDIVD